MLFPGIHSASPLVSYGKSGHRPKSSESETSEVEAIFDGLGIIKDAGTGRDPDVKKRAPSCPGGSSMGVGSVQADSLQNHTHDQSPQRVTAGEESRPKNAAVNFIIKVK